ncbi:MAG: monovalent cation/H+ antiporter subunit D family protein [Desulfofustis sp.]|jgi:multicomponent Na+:H+ antiporter subunit D|nr:monovalent cation/H+ antiporter subunit D family protein [Desulfofustis sp.]
MNLAPEQMLLSAILIPALAVFGIILTGRWANIRELVSIMAGLILINLVTGLYQIVADGGLIAYQGPELFSGLTIAFAIEPLGMLFALVAGYLWLVTTVYSIGYMRGHKEEKQTRFFACFAVAISSVMGIAFSANLFTLFIFYEILTLSTYPLVTHSGTIKAKLGGRVYLGVLLTTSILFLLLAIIGTWFVTGSLDFRDGGLFDSSTLGAAAVLLPLYIFGIGKAAIMPFHRWLPAAMVAPTPVSALLHAVAVVKAGVFSVLKICVYVFGLDTLRQLPTTDYLLYLAAVTVLLASIVAMRQDNLKARLAYSTVSQLSYITIGALLATSAGVVGGAMHIAMHAFGKITLFFCAGAIMVAAHKTEISQMRGLGRQMPITMIAFFIGSLSIIGLPPTGGTWGKWFLMIGALDAGQGVIMAVLMISSLLNIAYLLPIPIRAFYPNDDVERPTGIKEAPLPSLVALSVTAAGCIVLFFFTGPLYELALAILS